ncbi:malonate decarboxylase holo-[acyl-carrier-protein] synthase [Herbaspirillum lusitanum]|uniref:malonate decarboxylase holo-[acyl-carrier-protein] synthase n=1 Tax=Herbaspirillum lusitanum TaxID=213312 RepID=UPI0022383213|nr:malonate decarboxylase holo-[acyl-carrier-protein] synthase [Herbaspirillum lusitanum]MCW5299117.1 malonate decarboxylase holo-[acyl-carrier-protein] synthase [Herbaspirillum lusitanum]
MSGRSELSTRHGLVWLNEAGWLEALACVADEHRFAVQRWRQQDWPAVIRRRDAGCTAGEICLGIALPPDQDGVKLRVPLRIDLKGVRAMRAPLAIADVIEHAGSQWRDGLLELHGDIAAQGLEIGVYGSLALQALTGQPYLRSASDIDLLFSPLDRLQLEQGVSLLQQYAARLPLDGEISFPSGYAVAWKEWAQACGKPGNRVLVKHDSGVALQRVVELLAGLEEHACAA